MITRAFVIAGDENPQIEENFTVAKNIEMAYPKGFYSMPDTDDEILVMMPEGSNLERVGIGVIEPSTFGLKTGDRLIITDNAYIKLQKDGTIDILSNTGTINIRSASGTINISAPNGNILVGGSGQTVDLNGTVRINGVVQSGD